MRHSLTSWCGVHALQGEQSTKWIDIMDKWWTKLNLSPRRLPSMLQDRKGQNRKRNTTGSALQKDEQTCTTALRPHYVVTKLPSINCRVSSFALLSDRAREPEPFSLPPFVFFGRLDGPAPALSAGVALRLPASATHVLQMRFVSWPSNMLPQLPWSRPPHHA